MSYQLQPEVTVDDLCAACLAGDELDLYQQQRICKAIQQAKRETAESCFWIVAEYSKEKALGVIKSEFLTPDKET